MAFQQRNFLKGSAVHILNEISIEYNFRKPEYEIECLVEYAELHPFRAKCSIIKDNCEYVHIGKPASTKKEAKQIATRKILEIISNYYIFSEEKIDKTFVNEEKINVIYESNLLNSKVKLYKWTHSCEKCYQHGHIAKNCYGPKRNKNYNP